MSAARCRIPLHSTLKPESLVRKPPRFQHCIGRSTRCWSRRDPSSRRRSRKQTRNTLKQSSWPDPLNTDLCLPSVSEHVVLGLMASEKKRSCLQFLIVQSRWRLNQGPWHSRYAQCTSCLRKQLDHAANGGPVQRLAKRPQLLTPIWIAISSAPRYSSKSVRKLRENSSFDSK